MPPDFLRCPRLSNLAQNSTANLECERWWNRIPDLYSYLYSLTNENKIIIETL